MTLLAALLLASAVLRLIAQTINQQLLAQKLPRKTKFRLRGRQKVKKAQSKTLKVAEESNHESAQSQLQD